MKLKRLTFLSLSLVTVGAFLYCITPPTRKTTGGSYKDETKEVIIRRHSASVIESSKEFFDFVKSQLRDQLFPGSEAYVQYTVERLDLKPLQNVSSVIEGPVYNDVTSFTYPLSPQRCPSNSSATKSLFVAVISAPSYFKKRRLIRTTWARHFPAQSHQVDLNGFAFVVGHSTNKTIEDQLKEESLKYGDILQVGMTDTYYNITMKVAGLLNWLRLNCPDVDFVLKADDDVYVNVRNLANVLNTLPSDVNRSMYGSEMTPIFNLEPQRNPVDKWAMGYDRWPWMFFPEFLRGALVLMAGSSVIPLLGGFQTTPFIPFDDVYLSGIVSRKVNVQVYTNEWFLEMFPLVPYDPCVVFETVSWLTRTSWQMISSDLITEQFYNGTNVCRYSFSENGSINTTLLTIHQDRDNIDFPFQLVTPITEKDQLPVEEIKEELEKMKDKLSKRYERVKKWHNNKMKTSSYNLIG